MDLFLLSNKVSQTLAESVARHGDFKNIASTLSEYSCKEIELHTPDVTPSVSMVGHDRDSNRTVIEALLHASLSSRKILVMPYLPYVRQERENSLSTLKMFLDILSNQGITVITSDVHGATPISNGYDVHEITHHEIFGDETSRLQGVIVGPDRGSIRRLNQYHNSTIAVLKKSRAKDGAVTIQGNAEEFDRKDCIIIDDIVDSAHTVCGAAKFLKESGAKTVKAFVTHNLLNSDSVKRINESEIDHLVVTNTITPHESVLKCEKIKIVDVGQVIANKLHGIIKKG